MCREGFVTDGAGVETCGGGVVTDGVEGVVTDRVETCRGVFVTDGVAFQTRQHYRFDQARPSNCFLQVLPLRV